MSAVDEETVDDLLYFARIGYLEEVDCQLRQASRQSKLHPFHILLAIKDPESGNTILHMAAANGHLSIIEYLLKFNPDTPVDIEVVPIGVASPETTYISPLLSTANHSGNTPLHYAVVNGQLPAVECLVNAGADLRAKNNAEQEPIQEAWLAEKQEVAEWLLDRLSQSAPEANTEATMDEEQ